MDKRILVVEPDAGIRESLRELIDRTGCDTSGAESAEQALIALGEKKVDVVITDIMLPGMNGLELTGRIKRDFDADVIVMTGYHGAFSYEEAIKKGASDFVFKPVRFEELLLRLKRVLRERELTQERMQMLEKLQQLVITDALTGLFNSRHFYNQLELEMDRSLRYKNTLSLLLLDIDHFKDYNDTYGHLEGDKLLVKLGTLIRSCLRKMDSAYRYGGEEFTALLPETSGDEAAVVAQRIQVCVATHPFYPQPGDPVHIGVSIGSTQFVPGEKVSSFVQRADKAMYLSKQNGRNRVSSLSAPLMA
jgi:two-component system, cell cycle response regulator